jgi:integrase
MLLSSSSCLKEFRVVARSSRQSGAPRRALLHHAPADRPEGLVQPIAEVARHKEIAEEVEQRHRAKAEEEAKRHLAKAERNEVHWPEAAARHRARYEAAKKRKPNSGSATANGAMTALRAIWNFMADRFDGSDDPPRNPVRLKGQWHTVKPRKRMLREDDLPTFYSAVTALENPIARDYIRLMLFTGLRRREGSSLRWKDVDFRGRILHVPITKSDRPLKLPTSDRARHVGRASRHW